MIFDDEEQAKRLKTDAKERKQELETAIGILRKQLDCDSDYADQKWRLRHTITTGTADGQLALLNPTEE